MPQSVTTTLSLSTFFVGLTDAQLDMVAAICEPATYQEGDVLLREKEVSDDLYVIGSGSIEVLMEPLDDSVASKARPSPVARLVHGQAFGEMALVDHGSRSATVRVCEDDTFVLRISREKLTFLCDSYPVLGYRVMRNLAADLALKIRIANLTIRQYQDVLTKAELE